jgi:hypothetical protein
MYLARPIRGDHLVVRPENGDIVAHERVSRPCTPISCAAPGACDRGDQYGVIIVRLHHLLRRPPEDARESPVWRKRIPDRARFDLSAPFPASIHCPDIDVNAEQDRRNAETGLTGGLRG